MFAEDELARQQGRFATGIQSIWTVGAPVVAVLETQPEFVDGSGKYIDFAGAGFPFIPKHFVPKLLEIAVREGTERALTWLGHRS
jgi:hypothetical protein